MEIIDFGCSMWAEDPAWTCIFDGVEGDGERNVRLGAFFQVQDMIDAGAFGDDAARPWIVIAQIYPLPEELSTRYKAAVDDCMGGWPEEDHRDKIVAMTGYASGVPFDPQAIRPASAGENRITGLKRPAGIEMPCFATAEEARTFCRSAAEMLPVLFGMIGFFLDKPVNLMGETGWEYIRSMVGRQ